VSGYTPHAPSPAALLKARATAEMFRMGWNYGKELGEVWTARQVETAWPLLTREQVSVYINGMEDGAKGDTWRLHQVETNATS